MDRLHAIRDVTWSYLYGIVTGTLLMIAVMVVVSLVYDATFGAVGRRLGLGEALLVLAGALVLVSMSILMVVSAALLLGIPLLLTAIAVVLLFQRCIERRLLVWCIAAPFVAALAWGVIEITVLSGRRTSVESHLIHPTALLFIVLAFTYAAVGSWKFYRLNRC